jgi:hypothetical protein
VSAAPYFDSGGFNRDQRNNIGVFLVDLDGTPYVASGGTGGGGGGVVQLQFREGGVWVNAPGTAARGLLVDNIAGGTDAQVGLPARSLSIAGYDGTNLRAIKTSAAGVLQVDILSGAGGTQYNEGDTDSTITGTAMLWEDAADTLRSVSAAKPLPVNVVAGGASGVQYTEADVDSTITGNALMWEDTSDTLRVASVAKPLPVAQQGTVTVSGTVTATGPLTDTQLRATPVPISGTVTATGPLTDTQLRASAVPVDTELTTADLDTGAGTDTRAVVGLVRAESGGGALVGSANPLPVTGPLTDTQIRATALPVSGPVTDAQLRASAVPVSLAANQSVNVTQLAGTAVSVNSGVKDAGTQRVVLATDQPALSTAMPVSLASVPSHAVTNAGTFATQESGAALTSLQLLDDTVFTDDAAFTVATSKVSAIGAMADEVSTDSVDEGDIGIPRMTLNRVLRIAETPTTLGGLTPHQKISAATTNATSLKASAGQLYWLYVSNVNAAARYIKFYDKATAPTVGTDTPVLTILVPGNAAGAGGTVPIPSGIAFGTGIAYAITTGVAVADTGAVAANEIVLNLGYN